MKKSDFIKEDYLAPSVKVIKFIEQGVLCNSEGYDDLTCADGQDITS